MPMSCSMARGPQQLALGAGRPRAGPPRRARRTAPSASRATCSTCGLGRGHAYWRGEVARPSRGARRRTAAASLRRAGARRTRPRAGRPRWPRCASKPPTSSTACDDERAGEDEVGARGLDARDLAALGRRQLGEARRRGRRAPRASMTKPCTPNSGSSAARCAAAARLRTVPPMPTMPRARRRPATARARARRATCVAQRAAAASLAGPSPGRKRSVMRTAPSGQEPSSRGVAAARRARAASSRRRGRARRRRRASSSSPRPGSRSAPPPPCGSTRTVRPGRARRARGTRPRCSRRGSRSSRRRRPRRARARGGAEVREDLDRRQRARHARLAAARPSRRGPRRCGPPRRSRRCASTTLAGREDDEPEGVRPEVDDRRAPLVHARIVAAAPRA